MTLVMYRLVASMILPILILTTCISPAAAQDLDGQTVTAIDAFVADEMQELKIPGLALGIVHGDQIVYLKGYGVADTRTGRRVTPQIPFLLASLTKSFTALAIMQLVEDGKIDLNAPVRQYIPWFRPGDTERPIQVSDLLYHTAGFSTYTGQENLVGSDTSDDALENDVHRLSAAELDRQPGASYEYSNAGYEIAGYLVQVVSGQSYESYVRDHILAPLKMRHSWLSEDQARADAMTERYYPFFGIPVIYNVRYSRSSMPAGGILSSAEDMAHYVIAHLNEGRYGDAAIISPAGMARLHRPGAKDGDWNSYALGWNVSALWADHVQVQDGLRYSAPTVLQHEGSGIGTRTSMLLVPEDGWGVVTLMNTNDPTIDSAFGSVGYGVMLLLMGLKPPPTSVSETFLAHHARRIGIGLVFMQVLILIGSIRIIRRWRRDRASRPVGRLRPAPYIVLPAAIDIALVTWILVVVPRQAQASLPDIMRPAPDVALLLIAILALAVVWGTLRTVLYLWALHDATHHEARTALPDREPVRS